MLKNIVKAITPRVLFRWRQRQTTRRIQDRFLGSSAHDTFKEVYESNLWGGEPGQYYSGDGSNALFADQYAAGIRNFIKEFGVKSIVDLGCGDFRVAQRFVSDEISYLGVDVVSDLIERNKREFSAVTIDFLCMDITKDALPAGELCLIRQVLQHLSNAEISEVLRKCHQYSYLIITEHYPAKDRPLNPNVDIPHGPGIRAVFDSAVVLDEPPFMMKDVSTLFEVTVPDGTVIKSFLISKPQLQI